MLILLCGNYKTGKTISAATFPKPMLFEDWDGGFTSIENARDKTGRLLIEDVEQIKRINFYRQDVYDLNFLTDMGTKMAPIHTMEAPTLIKRHNDIIRSLSKDGTWEGVNYKTLVIDSLTNMYRTWKESLMRMNNVSSLRIPDYGTLENVLLSQFIPSLKSLLGNKKLEYIILVDHIETEKDEITGRLLEYPVGPSRNMGRNLGIQFDEVYLQQQEGGEYVWRTKRAGLFQAGSRLDLPEVIKPATFQALEAILNGRVK